MSPAPVILPLQPTQPWPMRRPCPCSPPHPQIHFLTFSSVRQHTGLLQGEDLSAANASTQLCKRGEQAAVPQAGCRHCGSSVAAPSKGGACPLMQAGCSLLLPISYLFPGLHCSCGDTGAAPGASASHDLQKEARGLG